jgi:hypothetical protein
VFSRIKNIVLIASACLALSMVQVSIAGMEDPLRPPEYGPGVLGGNAKAPSEPVWLVNEILFSGSRRIAIINDVAVAIGDRINGARVIDIKPEHVVLEYKNAMFNSRLHSVSVKKQNLIKLN